jgi:hypothetical protein
VIKVEELERAIFARSSSSEDVRDALVEAQRKIIVLKVNEEALTRRYIAASESEKALCKEIQKLKVLFVIII